MNANDYRHKKEDLWNAYRYPLTNIGASKANWRKAILLDKVDVNATIAAYQADAIEKVSEEHINLTDPNEDIFPAMVWHYMNLPFSAELIKKRKVFEVFIAKRLIIKV